MKSFLIINEIARPATIEEPLNAVLLHPVARAILPLAVRLWIAPNAISIAGIGFGVLAALAYQRFDDWRFAVAGGAAMLGWHVLDGLDGMVARATGRTSAFGRFLDGFCDYTVYILVYCSLAIAVTGTIGGLAAWGLALAAGGAHAVQAAYYEARREAYLRRIRGDPAVKRQAAGGYGEHAYNAFQTRIVRGDDSIDARAESDPAFRKRYATAMAPPMRQLNLLAPTGRTLGILAACLAGSPVWFWIWEIAVLSVAAFTLERRWRQLEAGL